jgi:tetratricopeptide (TPR) repeat protein
MLSQVIKAQPRSAGSRLLLGQALLEAGNLPGAEAEFQLLAKQNPESAIIQVWLGRVYGAKGEVPRARAAFTRALELEPSSMGALNGLVALDLVEGNRDAARRRIESRLNGTERNPELLFLAANTYLSLDDAARAESLLQQVLAANPKHVDAYGRLGALYWSQGRLGDAKTKFEEAARQLAKPVVAITFLGMLSQLQNNAAEARRHYERALQIDPQAAVAANNLASMYAENGENLDVALQLAQTATAQLPDHALATDTLGWVYYKKGLGTLAVTTLQEAAKQDPANPIIQYHLGLAYLETGAKPAARQSLERALKLRPTFRGADDAKRLLATL